MILIFDLNHVAYRCLFAAKQNIIEVGWQYFKHVMFTTVFNSCKKFEATKVILAVDSKDNWRKKVFSEYKENRKENRDANEDIDWNEFFKAFQEFVDDVKKYFPFYVIQIKYMEADDIAALITKNYQSEEKVIITSDSDYVQLLKYNNVKIFDPIKTIFVTCENPENQLKAKIIMGDKGDNISAIKPKIGPKTAEKLVNSPELLKEMFEDKTVSYTKEDGTEVTFGEEYKEKFKRNKILIDLNMIPEIFQTKLTEVMTNYELPSGKEIAQYFIINKYRELTRKLEDLELILNRIKDEQKKIQEFNETFG
jgi:5'-3' exonuclease